MKTIMKIVWATITAERVTPQIPERGMKRVMKIAWAIFVAGPAWQRWLWVQEDNRDAARKVQTKP